MTERKKQNLLTGAGVLAAATVLVKIIGAIYKIPLTNLITVEGYAYFTGAYGIYNPLYAISMAGLPVAVSKLVSQNIELGKVKDAKKIFSVSRRLFFMVGLIGMVILFAVAVPYSRLVGSEMNYVSILVVAPCILFCCQMSSFRGYYEGLNNMTPTGVSQVIEAVVKLAFGLAATYVAFDRWLGSYRANNVDGVAKVFGTEVHNEAEALSAMYPFLAAVAISGVTLGSMFGLVYLFIRYKRKGFGFTREELVNSPPARTDKELRSEIIKIAAPVALSSLILNITNLIDDTTIRSRLAYAIENGGEIVKNMYAQSLQAAQTLDSGIKDYLYGTHGSVINIKNLIPTITLTLGISAIPILSKAWARKDHKLIKSSVESALRIALMISLPAGFGMAALAKPILTLLYPKQLDMVPIAAPMLVAYGLALYMFSISSPITSMLQALGRADIPLKSVTIGSVAKIILNFVLIGIPSINIYGAVVSTIVCYAIMLSINLLSLIKITNIKLNFVSIFVKPFFSSVLCGVFALLSYKLFNGVAGIGNTISTMISICVGAGIYAVSLLLIKGIEKEDVLMLPKGDKIAGLLQKLKLMK